jgi:hypothetical protein
MANRKLKIPALAIILFFTFGVWCTNFLVSNLPTLTSQRSDFECSFGLLPRSLSNKVLTSSRSDGFAKGGQFWVTAGFPLRASEEPLFSKQDIDSAPQITSTKKVPIHLINSVLTI